MSADPNLVRRQVADWWASNPMTYGDQHGATTYEGSTNVRLSSREFFDHVDQVFYSWNRPLHSPAGYFAKIFPYDRYRDRAVLEVGCGMGTMAMNWALRGAQVAAVDLNATAVEQTTRRFELFGLSGDIRQADGNKLPFADQSFDYVYSWGVLHHSPNLQGSLCELLRVLRSGEEFGVMLYNRRSLLFGYTVQFVEGFLHGESLFLDPLALASRYGDGMEAEGNPHTWPITEREIRSMIGHLACDLEFRRLGTELDNVLPQMIPVPKFNQWVPTGWRKAFARRWGWSLWFSGRKR